MIARIEIQQPRCTWRTKLIQGDLGCHWTSTSPSSRAPSRLFVNTPFGERTLRLPNRAGYTAQFEPWFCRILLELGAHPVGVDIGNLDDETFEHYKVDLGQEGALNFLPDRSFDAVQDSRLFGSPEFTAQFPAPADRLKVALEIRKQERRLLKAGGRELRLRRNLRHPFGCS